MFREEFSKYGLTHLIKSHFQDVYVDGFHVKDAPKVYADAAFLDLPEPWKALNHVQKHLKPLARLCTFSPCIEQIQKTAEWLHSKNFLGTEYKKHHTTVTVFSFM
jgi:tRNA (adenine57-N1/adenine58-N1)-methyltransferase catalytic subunit